MRIQLPDDAALEGYKQSPHCPCLHCREDVYHSPSKNFTGTDEEFFEAGHAYSFIELANGGRSIILSPKALKDAGLLEPVSGNFTPWTSWR